MADVNVRADSYVVSMEYQDTCLKDDVFADVAKQVTVNYAGTVTRKMPQFSADPSRESGYRLNVLTSTVRQPLKPGDYADKYLE